MKRFKSLIVAACAAFVAVAYALPAPAVSAQGSAALSIVPKKNYTIDPGKSINDTLVIRNLDAEQELNLSLRVVDFTYTDDGGSPKLLLDKDAETTAWSLKPFLTVPESVTIPPKESRTVDMNLAVPANHGGGSYYSAIVYSSSDSDGGNVGLSASGVTLAFANVTGDVNEDLKLEDFGPYFTDRESGTSGYRMFTMEQPVRMAYTLKNNGNVTEAPVGSITLKHMFGKEITIDDVNPNESLALIGQSRTYQACIKLDTKEVNFNGARSETATCVSPNLWPGFYSTSLDLFYGRNGEQTKDITSSGWFLYMPLWFIILLLVIVGILGFFIYRLVNKIRGGSKKSKRRK